MSLLRARISELSAEKRKVFELLLASNQTKSETILRREQAANRCIHELFEEQVERTPHAVAIVYETEHLTYEELNRRSNQLARYLRGSGVGPESRVGLCLNRSLDMVVGLMGILKAGGSYLPLEPTQSLERLASMVEYAQVQLLLTSERLRASLPSTWTRTIALDRDWREIERESGENLDSGVIPENLAYVIYTSGSSGEPKAVAVEHRQLVNYVIAINDVLQLRAGASLALASTFAADLGYTMLYPSLCFGGKLNVLSAERAMHGRQMAEYMEQNDVEYLKIAPSHLKALLAWRGKRALPHKQLLLGGEAWSWEWLREVKPDCEVVNHYGPTECTVGAVAARVAIKDEINNVPLGKPLRNVCTYVLDQRMEPVSVAAKGELYIGGAGVARGYLNRPELTAAYFVPDPFAKDTGARLYRTGDLVKWREDGNLEFIGRIDDQVKIRGYRVEPRAIEAMLLRYSGVQEAVVVARAEKSGDETLIAYLVANKDRQLEPADIKQLLRQSLPDYMIPSAFVFLDSMPLKHNGKIDRKGLPAPEVEHAVQIVEPRDFIEMRLKLVWEEVLGIQNLSLNDNFFELGGHSLSAVVLAARLSDLYGSNFNVQTIFERPTVRELAALVRDNVTGVHPSSLVPIQPHGTRNPFFVMHPSGGTVQCYSALSRHLGLDQPFYGFQSRGLDGIQTPLTSIEDMAAAYIEELRVIQPVGPYQIGGWSLGGHIAYEIARELRSRGEEIKLLVLFDTRPSLEPMVLPVGEEAVRQDEEQYLDRIFRYASIAPDGEDSGTFEQKLAFAVEKHLAPTHLTVSQYRQCLRVTVLNERARRKHLTKSYSGDIVLFKSEGNVSVNQTEAPPEDKDGAYGWTRLTGAVKVFSFPERHPTFLAEANASRLATALDEMIGNLVHP